VIATTCKGCGLEFVAETEDELVTDVQAHIAEAHAKGHSPTREQVLAVIRRRGAHDPPDA
jgi:predicted small metal-binding protein